MGTCHLLLLIQWLNHVLLPLLTFNTPWREFRVENRNEALHVPGLQIARRFQSWSYEPNPCIFSYLEKYQIPSWWHQLLVTSRKPFVKCLTAWTPPSPESHLLTSSPPPTSLKQFLRAVWGAVSQAAVLILLQIKLNSQFLHCAFFFFLSRHQEAMHRE